MASSLNNLKENIQELIDLTLVTEDSCVILSLSKEVPKDMIKGILETFIEYSGKGTLCLIGDCSFNSAKSNLKELSDFTEGERRSIFTSQEIKVLALLDDMKMSYHPSLEIACIGKEKDFLVRNKSLDFPYGEGSIFEDLYHMDAIYFSIGKDNDHYPLKYAQVHKEIITRNVCLHHDKTLSYLDFEFNHATANEVMDLVSYTIEDTLPVSAVSYKKIIDILKEKI